MICDKCGLDMRLMRADFKVTGDNAADTETKLFQAPMFQCLNPACQDCGKEVAGELIPIELKA